MPTKTSLKICLSFLFMIAMCGCGNPNLPPRPDGLICTHLDGKFYCNEINNPDVEKEFTIKDPDVDKATCMPLETFDRYQSYVQSLKELADRNCRLE